MLKRYFKSNLFLDTTDKFLAKLILNAPSVIALTKFLKDMNALESTTERLLSAECTVLEARIYLTEQLLSFSPDMAADANIVHSPHFEKAIVKNTGANMNGISDIEKRYAADLELDGEELPVQPSLFALQA